MKMRNVALETSWKKNIYIQKLIYNKKKKIFVSMIEVNYNNPVVNIVVILEHLIY